MIKIKTLFKKNEDNNLVIPEINLGCEWVYFCGVPTRKFDGAACAIIKGELYKRYDCKRGKTPPKDSIPCQNPDPYTDHWPHWVKCERVKKEDAYFFEGYDNLTDKKDGTYELCGEKINGNKEKIVGHKLMPHGQEVLEIKDFSFNSIKNFLSDPSNDIEGIVFHAADGSGAMCKTRKIDFGVKRC
jgi:hypothetical protein